MTIICDFCSNDAKGEITYDDGEVIVGCADCLLDIVSDPNKRVSEIREYTPEDLQDNVSL